MEGIMRTLVVLSAILYSGVQAAVGRISLETIKTLNAVGQDTASATEFDAATGTVFIATVNGVLSAYNLANGSMYTVQGTNPNMGGAMVSTLTVAAGGTRLVYGGASVGQLTLMGLSYLSGSAAMTLPFGNNPSLAGTANTARAIAGTNYIVYGTIYNAQIYDTTLNSLALLTLIPGAYFDHRTVDVSDPNIIVLGGSYDPIVIVARSNLQYITDLGTPSYSGIKTYSTGVLCQPSTGKIFELAFGNSITTLQRLSYTSGTITEDSVYVNVPQEIFNFDYIEGMQWLGSTDFIYVAGAFGVIFYRANALTLELLTTNFNLRLFNTKIMMYSLSKSVYTVPASAGNIFWFTYTYSLVAGGSPPLGVVKAEISLADCAVPGCISCPSDASAFRICFACATQSSIPHLVLPTPSLALPDTCIPITAVPPAMGKDPTASFLRLAPCSLSSCTACLQDSTRCTDSSSATPTLLVLDSRVFDLHTATVLLVFSLELLAPIDLRGLTMWVQDLVTGTATPCTPATCIVSTHPLGLSVVLAFPDLSVLQGTFYINKASQSVLSPFASTLGGPAYDGWPIAVEGVVLTPAGGVRGSLKTTRVLAESSSSAASVGRSVLSLVNAATNPTAATSLDRLISEFSYLRFIGGGKLNYPDTIFDTFSETGMLPFKIPNPFTQITTPISNLQNKISNVTHADEDNAELAQPPYVFARNRIAYNILYNRGDDLIVLAGYLAICLLITLLHLINKILIAPKIQQKLPRLNSVLQTCGTTYGLRYFVCKIDSMSMELLIFSMLNTSRRFSDPPIYSVGYLVSWILMGVYSTYGVLLYFYTRSLSNKIFGQDRNSAAVSPSINPLTPLRAKSEPEQINASSPQFKFSSMKKSAPLTSIISMTDSPLWIVSGLFEDLSIPSRPLFLYSPLFSLLRNALLAILLVHLPDYPVAQTQLMIFVHTMHTLWTIFGRVRLSRIETIKDIVDSLLGLAFLVRQELLPLRLQRESKTVEHRRHTSHHTAVANIQQPSIFVVHNCKEHHRDSQDSERDDKTNI
jgi:hypothetical protein